MVTGLFLYLTLTPLLKDHPLHRHVRSAVWSEIVFLRHRFPLFSAKLSDKLSPFQGHMFLMGLVPRERGPSGFMSVEA